MSNKPQIRGRRLIDEKPWVRIKRVNSKSNVKIVDLFAGIGGFHYGIAAAASKINKGVKPLLVSELDPKCRNVYERNHDCVVQGDINEVSLRGIKEQADIVTAGFPCQPFSNSGLKLGLSDPRGQFYYKIVEIIKKYDAKSFILENVSGIRTNGGKKYDSQLAITDQKIGKSMHVLEENLMKLKDYHIQWLEIDSSKFGSPQVRKRVYIVGVKMKDKKKLVLKFNEYKPKCFLDVVEEEFIDFLKLSENQESNIRKYMAKKSPSFHDGMRRVGQAYTCPVAMSGRAIMRSVWCRLSQRSGHVFCQYISQIKKPKILMKSIHLITSQMKIMAMGI